MEERSPYTNGPYLVLSDGSTYDAADGCVITYVTDAGQEQLEESGTIEPDEMGWNMEVVYEIGVDGLPIV